MSLDEDDAKDLILNKKVESISHHGNILYLNLEDGKTVTIRARSKVYLTSSEGGEIHTSAWLDVKVDLPSTDPVVTV